MEHGGSNPDIIAAECSVHTSRRSAHTTLHSLERILKSFNNRLTQAILLAKGPSSSVVCVLNVVYIQVSTVDSSIGR